MAKFNTKQKRTRNVTENLAGGQAYALDKKTEFATILLSWFCEDQFYRTTGETTKRVKELVKDLDPTFVAKSAIFARDKFNMRSATHLVAAELAKNAKGVANLRRFFDKVVVRPDDMTEIVSLASVGSRNNGKARLPKALKEGFKTAFDKFDGYQLAKYRGEGKDWSLIDIVNMVRPIPTDANYEALKMLVADKLRSKDTWEAKLTKAGKNEGEKAQVWADLLQENKLGYMALLRNLRNIIQQAPECIDLACKRLTNERAIKKSRVLPFRFLSAYKEIEDMQGTSKVLKAISQAADISLQNVPSLENTLVVLDDSGSMGSPVAGGKMTCVEAGALFSAALVKSNDSEFMMFSSDARYFNLDSSMPVLPMVKHIMRNTSYCGTNFNSIFRTINKAYDRIIIFSDEQGWEGYYSPEKAFQDYKIKFNCNPYVYSVDLRSYGTTQFNNKRVSTISGFSEKIFDIMEMVESDKEALVREIEAVEF